MKTRSILFSICLTFLLSQCTSEKDSMIMTVNGPISAGQMGTTLTHEHILVDFIGADSISEKRWNISQVMETALPYLKAVKELGCNTLIECTPAYLGRDPQLLRSLSNASGLNILTNTGYYGAGVNNKFLPKFAFDESADQLSKRWINEWENGIGDSGVKPGFIKIGVTGDSLSALHRKLVVAAARTHLRTGMTIASHTGPANLAFEELDILKKEGVSPEAFIWVHAQSEKDHSNHIKAARMGAWIGLDGISDDNIQEYVSMIKNLNDNKLLQKILLSHDAGWYHPGETNGGQYRGYTSLFEKLVPLLLTEGFSDKDINQLLVINPAEAFKTGVHKIN
jgi:phosphotriesterase-related protein